MLKKTRTNEVESYIPWKNNLLIFRKRTGYKTSKARGGRSSHKFYLSKSTNTIIEKYYIKSKSPSKTNLSKCKYSKHYQLHAP